MREFTDTPKQSDGKRPLPGMDPETGRFLPGNRLSVGKGRPPGSKLRDHLLKLLDAPCEEWPEIANGEALAAVIMANAKDGKPWAIEMLLKRLWPERLDVSLTPAFARRVQDAIESEDGPDTSESIGAVLLEAGVDPGRDPETP